MPPRKKLPSKISSATEISQFLDQTRALTTATDGRLIFALDATASRQRTWAQACDIQAEMFSETSHLGKLSIQLCYYRGFHDFQASLWHKNAGELLSDMANVSCVGGRTQIEKLLRHTISETKNLPVDCLVFIGDCVEEDSGILSRLAGELGILGVKIFVFHEGSDHVAEAIFQKIAVLSHGACCKFDLHSADQLKTLLNAAAVYATKGKSGLKTLSSSSVHQLLQQLDQSNR